MNEHTKTDGLPAMDASPVLQVLERAAPRNERMAGDKIECNACPVLCQISAGKTGACDRYANAAGVLVGVDPVVFLRKALDHADVQVVAFAAREEGASANAASLLPSPEVFVTGIGASTTYPDYKPAPFIVSSQAEGVDLVTVVTEGIFSYC